jgi:4-alpha-glucanotransferase
MRRIGLSVPLFSARSTQSWGIGEIPDLIPLAAWLRDGGFSRLMVLPLGTVQRGETSPYSATSTLSIDPVYVATRDVEDFTRAGGEAALAPETRCALDESRRSRTVAYDLVRRAKYEALDLAFRHFYRQEWQQQTDRARALREYIHRERAWLDDYALFLALADTRGNQSWRDWPAALRDREPEALDAARSELSAEIVRHSYWQWLAEAQWQRSRAEARALGVAIYGDLPFVAHMQSPEVWARASEFMLDVSAGVPPDAFSETGQDWGLPTYRWDAIAASGYSWTFQRGRRMAALYDGLRVDHVIGIYRTYGRPPDGEPFFNPAEEEAQVAQGEAVLRALQASGLELIAEDLGVVPDFLRPSLARLGVPGCKVLRWERDWHAPDQPFLDPTLFPAVSVAMTGTHDTEPLPSWWDDLTGADRLALFSLPVFQERGFTDVEMSWNDGLRDALLETAYRAGSADVFLPIQDLFGWRDRINAPGSVGPHNWTWTMPWPVDAIRGVPEAAERAGAARRLAAAAERLPASD